MIFLPYSRHQQFLCRTADWYFLGTALPHSHTHTQSLPLFQFLPSGHKNLLTVLESVERVGKNMAMLNHLGMLIHLTNIYTLLSACFLVIYEWFLELSTEFNQSFHFLGKGLIFGENLTTSLNLIFARDEIRDSLICFSC